MNYYPFHIGDFRGATLHLSNAEELAYRRALDWYYDNEKPIPLDTQWVSRRLRVDTQDLETVLKDFFIRTEEGWRHTRCDAVLADYAKQAEKNRANGRKGGRPKGSNKPKNNPVGSESDASGRPVESEKKPNQEPKTNNQEPNSNTGGAQGAPDPVVVVFDHWKATMESPRSLLDDKRRKTIKAALKTGYTVEQLCQAIDGCRKSPYHMGQNDRATKYNGLDLILRNAEKIDQFIVIGRSPRVPTPQGNFNGLNNIDHTSSRDAQQRSIEMMGIKIDENAPIDF